MQAGLISRFDINGGSFIDVLAKKGLPAASSAVLNN